MWRIVYKDRNIDWNISRAYLKILLLRINTIKRKYLKDLNIPSTEALAAKKSLRSWAVAAS